MTRRDIEAGGAFIRLFVKDDGALKKLGRKMRQFGSDVAQIGVKIAASGAAALTPLIIATKQFASDGGALAKLALQTGATVKELSQMQFAARQFNIDVDDLTGSIEELNLRLGETITDGTGPAGAALAKLGLDARQLADAPLPERFGAIADALSKIENQATRGFLADEIFGGDAFKILPLLQQGADGIRQLTEEADRLGLTLTQEQIDAAVRFNKAWKEITNSFRGVVRQMGAALAPAMTRVLEIAKNAIGPIRDWFIENKRLAVGFAAFAAGLVVIGGVIAGVGAGFIALGAALSTAATLVGILVSPVGAAVSALVIIGGVVAALIARFTDWGKITGSVSKLWEGFSEQMGDVMKGLRESMMAGDFESANRIMWLGVQKVWEEAFGELRKMWIEFKNGILILMDEMILNDVKVGASRGFFNQIRDMLGKSNNSTVKRLEKTGLLDFAFDFAKEHSSKAYRRKLENQLADRGGLTSEQLRGEEDVTKARLSSIDKQIQEAREGIKETPFGKAMKAIFEFDESKTAVDKFGPGLDPTGFSPGGGSGVTFNAAAAIAGNFGGSQNPMTRKLDELKSLEKMVVDAVQESAAQVRKLAEQFVFR